MPRMTPEDLVEYLNEPHVGVIASLKRDGSPYTVPVWWLWEPDSSAPAYPSGPFQYAGGDLWLVGTTNRIWCKQLMHDGRSSLCIESGQPFTAHVEFDGVCEALMLPEFDIWPMSRRLAEKYVGRGDPANRDAVDKFFDNMKTEPRMLFRMRPSVVRAIDMRVYRGKRADREHQAGLAREGRVV